MFLQQTIAMLAKGNAEVGVKLYLDAALTADKLASIRSKEKQDEFGPIAYELISQSFALYEENAGDSKLQSRCIIAMVGTLLACRSLSKDDYERLIMKTAQYAAKMLKKSDQCEMVSLCAHLFYVVGEDVSFEMKFAPTCEEIMVAYYFRLCFVLQDSVIYSNPQRALECLQRALKLADACTSSNPANLRLFVDLLDRYLYFFENKNPSITASYITGLVALIKEHADNLGQFGGTDSSAIGEAKAHFAEIVRHIKRMKARPATSELFASIDLGNSNA